MRNYADWDKLTEFLNKKTGMAYFNGSKSELICKCPKPGCDDNPNTRHGHLYISTENPVFNCFKCGFSGFLPKLLYELKANPEEYLLDATFTKMNYSKFNSKDIIIRNVPDINEESYKLKRLYLKERLGADFKVDEIPNLVYNISEFIRINKIELTETQSNMLDYYDSNFVGFVCNRGYTLILRNVDKSAKIKHVKMLLKDKSRFTDFYGIKTNKIHGDVNTIVLCEGVFDLLFSLKSSIFNDLKLNSCFWAASLGKTSYLNTVRSVINYCKLPLVNVIILGDNDVEDDEYNSLNSCLSINSLKVLINSKEKDFGTKNVKVEQSTFRFNPWKKIK